MRNIVRITCNFGVNDFVQNKVLANTSCFTVFVLITDAHFGDVYRNILIDKIIHYVIGNGRNGECRGERDGS